MNVHNVGVRMQVVGGDKMKAEFVQIGQAGTRALGGIGKSANSSRFAMQNAAFQVGDFFTQVAGGTAATRALAQQLPQLLGSFGLFGALAGAAAAALVPFIGSLFDAGEEAEKTEDVLKEMEASTRAYIEAAKASRVSVDELARTYGTLAREIEATRDRTNELARARNASDIGDSAKGSAAAILGEDFVPTAALREFGVSLDDLYDQALALREQLETTIGNEDALLAQIDALDAYIVRVQELQEAYGISADEAARLVQAANALGEDGSVEDQARAADALADELVEVFGSIDAVNSALPKVLDSLDAIVFRAGDLNAELGLSAQLAADIAAAIDRGERADAYLKNSKLIGAYQLYADTRMAAPDTPPAPRAPRRSSGGGGGGGGVNPGLREAERLLESTRTAAEKYADEVERINELHRLFGNIVTEDVRDRALEQLKEEFTEIDGYAKDAASAIRSAFDGLFDDPIAALDQLGKKLIQMALYQQLALSFPGVFGKGGIIPLTSFDGGGFTGSGSRSGGLDGKGGFLSMLHPNETVIDHTKGASGGISVQIINNSGQPAREERSRGPDGRELVKVVVGEEMSRGGFDKPMQSRFGNRPQRVKR